MSDVKDELSTPGARRPEPRELVVSFAADDRDWAEWVADHLAGLGHGHRLLEPPLGAGEAALREVHERRAAGEELVVIASDALLHDAPDTLDLDRVGADTAPPPLIVVLIEDVPLPAEWGDAVRAPMFDAPDDYQTSRQLLVRALEQARPGSAGTERTPRMRRDLLPEPLVVLEPFPPPPAPGVALLPLPLPSIFEAPAAGTGAATHVTPAGSAPDATAAAPTAPTDELPSPATRPGAGLFALGAAGSLQAAEAGGASVTETERAPTTGTGAAGPADAADAADVVGAAGAGVSPAGDAAAPGPDIIDGGPGIIRLPFSPPDLLWPLDDLLGALERGLQSRFGEQTEAPTGLFAPRQDGGSSALAAASGVLLALTAPLGTGTTTVALAHAHRQLTRLDVLWWIRGGNADTVRADLRALAVAIGIDATDHEGLLDGLRRWLETTDDRWLLVVDDLVDEAAIDGLLPTGGRGQVVVTGRAAPAGSDPLVVTGVDPESARRILADAAGHRAPTDPAAGESSPEPDGAAVEALASLLDQPWALAIAASLLAADEGAEPAVTPEQLLDQLRTPPPLASLPDATAANPADATVLAALRLLADRDPALPDAVIAVLGLAPCALPARDVEALAPGAADRAVAVRLLTAGDDVVAPVPAAAAALARLVGPTTPAEIAERRLALVDAAVPVGAGASTVDLWAPHLMTVTADGAGADEPRVRRLATVLADWSGRLAAGPASADPGATVAALRAESREAGAAGRHLDAVRLLDELVALDEATRGPDDLHTLASRTELALALTAAGNRLRANQVLSAVLEDTRRVYGDDHPATTLAEHNLANSDAELGRHDEALALRRDVLAARERTLGAEHPQTVSARSNLANSLSAVGRADEALALRDAVAEVRVRTLGPEHTQTLGALNNLANSYADVDRHEDALRLRRQVLEGRERVLGADHPHTITARNNLANSLAAVGRHDEARQARERTLADSERVLGPDHPHTLTARANLAFTGAIPAPAPQRPAGASDAELPATGVSPTGVTGDAPGPAAEPTVERADATGGTRKKRFWFFFWRR